MTRLMKTFGQNQNLAAENVDKGCGNRQTYLLI